MKIGYILGLKQGIHRFIYRELCAMEEMDCEVSIFTTKNNPGVYNPHDNWKVYDYNKVSLLLFQVLYFLKQPSLYLKLFSEAMKNNSIPDFFIAAHYLDKVKNLDLIHAHFGDRKLYVAYFLKRFTNIPLTVTIHAHELWRNPNWKMFHLSMRAADRIVSISDFNKQYMIDNFQFDPEKIDVIKLYVDQEDVISDKKHILVVGSYEERKGYDVLFKAMKILNRDDYTIWCAGTGHLDVPGDAKRMGLDHQIKFFGKIHADILNIMVKSCDFFCLPCKTVKLKEGMDREGIPVAIMEAMAYGKPVVTTKHVGIPELVENMLVEQDNPEQLAKAIGYLLDHPEVYASHGERNKKIIAEKFSKNNATTLKELFDLLAKKENKEKVQV